MTALCRTITGSGEPVLRVWVRPIPIALRDRYEAIRRAMRDGGMIIITENRYTRAYEVVRRKVERP